MADRSRLRALLNPDSEKLLADFPPAIREHVEIEKNAFAIRHGQAIQMLIEAEQFLCRDRVACLFEAVPDLESEALPEWFFLRLSRLESKLRAKGNKGPRNPERDDASRQTLGMRSCWAIKCFSKRMLKKNPKEKSQNDHKKQPRCMENDVNILN